MAQAPVLELDALSVRLPPGGERPLAVEQVSFTVTAGEILCIVGESGSGKSMVAHAIMGLLPEPDVHVDSGAARLNGEDLLAMSPRRQRAVRGTGMGMIFQEPMTSLNPLMRVGEQIEEALKLHTPLSASARDDRVIELLDDVGLPNPAELRRSYPFSLSGGQRQRVMIAIALAVEPDLLIADEPTTALDVTTQKQILELIADIQRRNGMGVILITHDFGVVAEVAHSVAVMQDGRCVEYGSAATVLNRPRHPYTRELIRAVPHDIVHRADFDPEGQSTILSAEGVRKVFHIGGGLFRKGRELVAADDVSLDIRRGETVGVVGESGSGKSTLGRCIVGLHKTDGGQILFRGHDLAKLTRREFRPVRRHVQMVFQDPYASLNPRYRIADIIAQGPVAFGTPRAEARARAEELLELVGLDASAARRYPHQFSGGQRQRISIARALALDPDLLIADEPVSALDVSVQTQVLALLDEIRRKLGLAMLFITHDLRVAAQVCDRIAVMKEGRIVEIGTCREVFGAPKHEYTRTLLDAIPGKDWQIRPETWDDPAPGPAAG